MAFDYWTKFIGGRNCDIYPPSRKSRAVPRDPTTILKLISEFLSLLIDLLLNYNLGKIISK
jgi:hypothetical protein